MSNVSKQNEFLAVVRTKFGADKKTISRKEIIALFPDKEDRPWWLLNNKEYRAGRGLYNLPISGNVSAPAKVSKKAETSNPKKDTTKSMNTENNSAAAEAVSTSMNLEGIDVNAGSLHENMIPTPLKGYVPFGNYKNVETIIKSNRFYPTYITGLSGNGKTVMVEQICAKNKREMMRVNITAETDEDDLIGGFRLENGSTKWHDGPVVMAMQRGAVLLLDECDLASVKIMCLQPVLEGKPVFLKKVGRKVVPAPGFTIVATANTKGKGSDDGRFIGTNVMNEAFLERFSVTFEQEYPSQAAEKKILMNLQKERGCEDEVFAECLVKWADCTRRLFSEGGISEIISTRRLVHITEAYAIFDKNRKIALELCVNRFDNDTREALLDLYSKIDAEMNAPKADPAVAAKAATINLNGKASNPAQIIAAVLNNDIAKTQAVLQTMSVTDLNSILEKFNNNTGKTDAAAIKAIAEIRHLIEASVPNR